jgi:hypothetical protein
VSVGASAIAVLHGCPSTPINANGVGTTCLDSSTESQSNCASGLVCLPLSTDNMCTASCQSDSDCGSTSTGFQNRCIELPVLTDTVACLRGCSLTSDGTLPDGGPADAGPDGVCGRTDFVCTTDSSSGNHYCIPDCRQQGTSYCGYGTYCVGSDGVDAGTANGACTQTTCTTTAGCPTGYGLICAPVNGTDLCVPNCATVGCASGTTCNSNGGCDTNYAEIYDTCGADAGTCDPNKSLACETFQDGTSICLQTCNTGSCPGATSTLPAAGCAISDGTNAYCLLECGPTVGNCPTNQSCQGLTSSDGSELGDFCEP